MTHWVSCKAFTVQVETNDRGTIIRAAPIAKRFVGQSLGALQRWAQGLGGYRYEALTKKGIINEHDTRKQP